MFRPRLIVFAIVASLFLAEVMVVKAGTAQNMKDNGRSYSNVGG